MQQSLDPLYYQRPLEERVRIAIDIAIHGNEPEVVRLSLALGPLPSLAHSIANGWGVALLNAVARAMGGVISRRQSYVDYYEMHLVGWELLLKDLIVQGANLHNISSEHSTPFLDFLQGLVFYPMELSVSDFDDMKPMELSRHELGDQSPRPSLLKIWLDCLQESGLDLEEYGRKEVDLHLQGLVSWTWLPYDPKPDRA